MKTTANDRIWAVIMDTNGTFTAQSIYKRCPYVGDAQIYIYLKNLLKAAIIERVGEEYKLTRPSREAPKFTKQGELYTPFCRQDYMWRTMRMLSGWFDLTDLARHASTDAITVKEDQARFYCNALSEVGILRKYKSKQHKTKYQLVKDLGGKAPVIKRVVTVFDPNSYQTFKTGDSNVDD